MLSYCLSNRGSCSPTAERWKCVASTWMQLWTGSQGWVQSLMWCFDGKICRSQLQRQQRWCLICYSCFYLCRFTKSESEFSAVYTISHRHLNSASFNSPLFLHCVTMLYTPRFPVVLFFFCLKRWSSWNKLVNSRSLDAIKWSDSRKGLGVMTFYMKLKLMWFHWMHLDHIHYSNHIPSPTAFRLLRPKGSEAALTTLI